jgi:hypothetical protein
VDSKPVNKGEATAETGIPDRFRRLKSHELVTPGDFVADEKGSLGLWEGPSGFRADAFVKAMYRLVQPSSPETKG